MTEQVFSKRKMEWIEAEKLSVVWAQAQRPLDERFAKSIADAFDPDMFGLLSVTLPNGKGIYHIVDGQHRKRAVEIAFGVDQKIPCQVFEAHDPARAARLFDEINTHRRAPNNLEFFKIRVTAKEPDHIAVNNIVKENGYRISSKAEADNSIACVEALLSIYRRHGAEVLDMTLKLLQATWGKDKNATIAPLVRGFGEFMAEFGRKVSWQRLHESVSKRYTPGSFHGTAKGQREMSGTNLTQSIKDLLILTYNRGQKVAGRIAPKKGDADE